MFRSRTLSNCSAIALLLLITLSVGCGPGGPDLGEVEGTVTLDGKPLENALVMFSPVAGGRPAGARTDAQGRYELMYTEGRGGALPGEHIVRISTYQRGDPEENMPKVPERVPARYNVKSELRETVDAAGSTIDFVLDSEGEIIEPRE